MVVVKTFESLEMLNNSAKSLSGRAIMKVIKIIIKIAPGDHCIVVIPRSFFIIYRYLQCFCVHVRTIL